MAINLNKLSKQSRKFREHLLGLNGSEKQIYSQRIATEGLQKHDASSTPKENGGLLKDLLLSG
jgi:hypothetical protein